jgi:hypothetical protein
LSEALDLTTRAGLPADMLWLREALPRDRWTGLNQTAAFWMQMHDGFRRQKADMAAAIADWRAGGDVRAFHSRILPILQAHLQHLDGHHRIESGHYFPQFRRAEPRIQSGLDLLDRDHEAVHAHLEAMFLAAREFHGRLQTGAPDPTSAADRLADAVLANAAPMLRHLEDEEDIVIPLIQRHGDGA